MRSLIYVKPTYNFDIMITLYGERFETYCVTERTTGSLFEFEMFWG
jgi:hypothetical protein